MSCNINSSLHWLLFLVTPGGPFLWPLGGTSTNIQWPVKAYTFNENQQWDSQGASHAIYYMELLKCMSLLVKAWERMVHWRKEWQTTWVFLPWEPYEWREKVLYRGRAFGLAPIRRTDSVLSLPLSPSSFVQPQKGPIVMFFMWKAGWSTSVWKSSVHPSAASSSRTSLLLCAEAWVASSGPIPAFIPWWTLDFSIPWLPQSWMLKGFSP